MPNTKLQCQNISNEAQHFLLSSEKGVKEEIDNEEKLQHNFNACIKNVNREEPRCRNKNKNEDENRDKMEIKKEHLNKNESILGKYEIVTVKMEEHSDNEQEVSKSIMLPKLETVPVSTTKTISPQYIKKHSVPEINGMSEIRIRSLKMLQNLIQTPKHTRKQVCDNTVCISSEATNMITIKKENEFHLSDNGIKSYPKPAYSYSCLIAMAIKNSPSGTLTVTEIYNFICQHFPYFKTAPNGWKSSLRYTLSANKYFVKCPETENQRKTCSWTIAPADMTKINKKLQKWSKEDPISIKRAMIHPDHLTLLEKGNMKYLQNTHPENVFIDTKSSSGGERTSFEKSTHDSITANFVTNNYVNEQRNTAKTESFKHVFGSCTKRRKTLGSTMHKKHMYHPGTAGRSAPLLLRTSIANCSFVDID